MVKLIEDTQMTNHNEHYASPDSSESQCSSYPTTEQSLNSEEPSRGPKHIVKLSNFKRYNEKYENFGRSNHDENSKVRVKIVGIPFVLPLETLWTGKEYRNVMIRFRHENDSNGSNERISGGAGGDDNCMACCRSPCHCQISRRLPKLEIIPCKCQATFADLPFYRTINCLQDTDSILEEKPTSLGTPVGLIQATSRAGASTPLLMRFPWYLKAMSLIYLKTMDQWTSHDLDRLIKEGKDPQMLKANKDHSTDDDKDALMLQSLNDSIDSNSRPTCQKYICSIDNDTKDNTGGRVSFAEDDIKVDESALKYMETEAKVEKSFNFNDHQFKIRLDEAAWQENLSLNLYEALQRFFERNNYCLILFRNWYLLIWKENEKFFVLDMNGRDPKTLLPAHQDKEANLPILICLKKLINVAHLIINMSKLHENASFLIRSLKFAEIVTPKGTVFTHQPDIRVPQYKTINDDYSYLRSNFHLSLNPEKSEINRCGLSVGIAAMIASKIDHPATWDSKTLDRVICYGVNLCRACWPNFNSFKEPINLDTFPRCIRMGQFLVNFKLKSSAFVGYWRCRPVSLISEFYAIIKAAFTQNEDLLFQINNQMYAMWQKNNFYYLLDPYLHKVWGELTDIDSRMATVRIFRNLDTLIKVFHHILLQSNRSVNFYIHLLKINGLVNSDESKDEFEMDIGDDLKSLNEYILFDEDYNACLNELGQSSDYGDIESTVLSESSLTTSLDEGGEEEGEGGGEVEGIEDDDEDDKEFTEKLSKFKSQRKNRKVPKVNPSSYTKNDIKSKNTKSYRSIKPKTDTRIDTDTYNRYKWKIDTETDPKTFNSFRYTKINTDTSTDTDTYSRSKRKSDPKNFRRKTDMKTDTKNYKSSKASTDIDTYNSFEKNIDIEADPKTLNSFERKTDMETDTKNYRSSRGKTNTSTDTRRYKRNIDIETDPKTFKSFREETDMETDTNIYRSTKVNTDTSTDTDTYSRSKRKTDTRKSKRISSLKKGDNNKSTQRSIVNTDNIINTIRTTDITRDTRNFPKNVNKIPNEDDFEQTVIVLKNMPKKTIVRKVLAPLHINDNEVTPAKQVKHPCSKRLRDTCGPRRRNTCNLENIGNEFDYKNNYERFKENAAPLTSSNHENSCNKRPRSDPFLDSPTIATEAKNLILSRSSSSTYESILKIFHSSLKSCDRVYISTRFGNFALFRGYDYLEDIFFLHEGCTCDVNRFRYMDLSSGTAGLIPFSSLHKVVTYIMDKNNGSRSCSVHGHNKERKCSTNEAENNENYAYFNYVRV